MLKSFEDTQVSKDKEKWNIAMKDELKMMEDRKVWKLVDPPSNAKIIKSKWVYKIKKDENNKIKKYKARLVALGYKQRPGIDYRDIFSPVVNFSVITFLFILLVSLLKWNCAQLDVKSAYLYGKIKEVVYMSQPTGFVEKGHENQVCLLNEAIYGLHRSGREWNCELNDILKNIGYDQLNWCNCVYSSKNTVLVV